MKRRQMTLLGLLLVSACAEEPTFELADIALSDGEISAVTPFGLEVVRLSEDGSPTLLAELPPINSGIDEQIVSSGSSLYFSRADGLYALPRAGGAPTRIEGASPYEIVAVGSDLYFIDEGRLFRRDELTEVITEVVTPALDDAETFTTDGVTVAWSTDSEVVVAELGSRSATVVFDDGAYRLSIGAGALWIRKFSSIIRVDLQTRLAEEFLDRLGGTGRLRIGPGHIYWIEGTNAFRAPLVGGDPEPMLAGDKLIRDQEIDGDKIYYLLGGRRLRDRQYLASDGEIVVMRL